MGENIKLTATYDMSLNLGDGLVQIFLHQVEGLKYVCPFDEILPVYFAVRDDRFHELDLVRGDDISGVIREEICHSIGGFMQSERYLRLGNVKRVRELHQSAAGGKILYLSDYKPRIV